MSRATLAAAAAAVAAATAIVLVQPVGDPWWRYADADATYTSSALNIAAGGHTKYFDHPGLPLQELGALAFSGWRFVDGASSPRAFANSLMLHLDRTRPVYRGLAILLYLLGAIAAFLVGLHAFRAPLWGLLTALLWLGSPGLAAMSIQFRPDVLLSWLALVCGYLIVRGYERRRPLPLLMAAVLVGFAVTVKLHVVGLLPPLILATLLAGPFPQWRGELASWLRAHRRALTVAGVLWLLAALYFDWSRIPFRPSSRGVLIVAAAAILGGAWLVVGQGRRSRLLGDFNGALVLAILVGVLVPVVVVLDDGLRSLPWVVSAALGRGVNSGVAHFHSYRQLGQTPLVEALAVFALAGVAAAVGAIRRDWSAGLWFLGATVMAALAFERLGATHYFAPAYALSIVPALGLARELRRFASVAAVALVLGIVVPQLGSLRDQPGSQAVSLPATSAVERLLGEREVALTPPQALFPDTLYAGLVENYVTSMPAYPFHTLPLDALTSWTMHVERLRPRLFVTRGRLASANIGDYTVSLARPRNLGGDYYAYRLLTGPGVDRPLASTPPPSAPEISR